MWSGRSPRLHPIDFERNPYTPQNASWPISYPDIEPYYEPAEITLGVRGDKLSGFHAPRKNDLPGSVSSIADLKALLKNIGITLDQTPTSSVSEGPGPVRVSRDLRPQFTESTGATLMSGQTVTALVSGADGQITAARVQSLDRSTTTVAAHNFVITCGALESARLLLLSRSEVFPSGIGNTSGIVGRYFMEHPNVTFRGTAPNDRIINIARSHQFYESFKHRGLGSVILRFWGLGEPRQLIIGATVEMEPLAENRISLADGISDHLGNPGLDLSLRFTGRDNQTLKEVRTLIRDIYGNLGVRDISEGEMSWSHHHLGGCRMGDDPNTSVTNPNLRVHDSPNLYVVGSSVSVTGGASHPTLAITALSHRLADHLTE